MTSGRKQIHLNTPVETAWAALVSPQRRRWYFRVTPEGNFAKGERIRWVDATGSAIEESEVIEVTPPRRLAMRTRLLFAPAFAKQPPHEVTWQVARSGKGCTVTLSWNAGEVVAGLF